MSFYCSECGHHHTGPGGICIGCACARTSPDVRDSFLTKLPQHGLTCRKVEHTLADGGYLHDANDDTPYDVDGIVYCGRCHEHLADVG